MARKAMEAPQSALDAIENETGDVVIDGPADAPLSPPEDVEVPVGVLEVSLTIPLADVPKNVHLQRHIDVRITQRQSVALRSLFEGLHQSHAKLETGRHVDTVQDTIKWLLERVALDAVV